MKLLFAILCLFSLPAMAGPYWAYGCENLNSGTECWLFMQGYTSEFEEQEEVVLPPNRPGDGTGIILSTGTTDSATRMKNAISSATGMAYGAVNTMVTGMRSAALGAGYQTFTATLSGTSGSVTFTMNLANGAWGIRGTGTAPGSHDGNGGKVRIP